ncbi:MAG: MAPEG family protein [Halocynthiibacter sp.]
MQTFPITGISALLLGALLLILTSRVISVRRHDKIALGDGGNESLQKRLRAHGNAMEQIPIFLIILGLCEASSGSNWNLGAISVVFITGRVLHAAYFSFPGTHWKYRFYGMSATLLAQAALLGVLAASLIL